MSLTIMYRHPRRPDEAGVARLLHRERDFPQPSAYAVDPDCGQASRDGAALNVPGNLFLAIELVQTGMTNLPLIAAACYLPLDTVEEIAAAHAVNSMRGTTADKYRV
jgi:hypothetical protein